MGKDNPTQNSGSPPLRFIQPELREDSESGESKAGVAGAHGSGPWKELTIRELKNYKRIKLDAQKKEVWERRELVLMAFDLLVAIIAENPGFMNQ